MNLDLFVSFCYNCQSQDYCLVLFGQKKFTTVHVCANVTTHPTYQGKCPWPGDWCGAATPYMGFRDQFGESCVQQRLYICITDDRLVIRGSELLP